ncbi:MAG: hypothetical protein WC707_00635 [Candidatus Babeliaceae bacterium]|jgi:hypothetical protein
MNIYKYISLIVALHVPGMTLQAMDKSIKLLNTINQASRVDRAQFKELAKYSQSFLMTNIDKLACQKNESGFIRINIPILKQVRSKFCGIKKIRANYWTPNAGIVISPESIHTHPNYFESFIVKGGYNHEIYEPGNKKNSKYDLYRILKDGDSKSFVFIGDTSLQFVKNECVEQGAIKAFDKKMIHRVMNTMPETLSLNVVFNDNNEDQASYNIYLTKHGKLGDVKTIRDLISNDKSKPFIHEIISGLEGLIKST